MGKYFGTDGFRGEANVGLTSMHAYRIGRLLGWYLGKCKDGTVPRRCEEESECRRVRAVIGKDTRLSSYMLEYAIASGLAASGTDAYIMHVTTTPSVSYITELDGFDCGIMITASHNPYRDNGIKLIGRSGEKLSGEIEEMIEAYLDGDMAALSAMAGTEDISADDTDLPLATGAEIGRIVDYYSGRNRYIGHLISLAKNSCRGMRIGIDTANGAAWMMARSVFTALGAEVYTVADTPDGTNINRDCGSTHPDALRSLVVREGLELGLALDGDGDRCIAIDAMGNIVDGDKIIYILARAMKSSGMLREDTVAVTVMSNSGLINSLEQIGIKTEITAVGDKYVHDCLQNKGYTLGGEQSGHIIIKKYANTGDGLLTGIMLLEEICNSGQPLHELCREVTLYPQLTVNVAVTDKDAVIRDSELYALTEEIEREIAGHGRILLRKSGTEPKIRIMAEAKTMEKCEEYTERIAKRIRELEQRYEA